jgi:hypothetical protein
MCVPPVWCRDKTPIALANHTSGAAHVVNGAFVTRTRRRCRWPESLDTLIDEVRALARPGDDHQLTTRRAGIGVYEIAVPPPI